MGDTVHNNHDEATAPEQDVVLELNFVPEWARKPPSEQPFFFPAGKSRSGRGENRRRPEKRSAPTRNRQGRERSERRPPARRPRQSPLPPLTVRFIPEERPLSAVARRMRSSKRAYPLMDVISLFLNNPVSCRVKIEDSERTHKFFQCSECGVVTLSREAIEKHVLQSHLQLFFDIEEKEGEAPSGNFVCVARCGLSGVLLGPPNHNSYAENIDEHRKIRFPDMSDSEYRRNIETVHEPELIEEWKESHRHQKLYRVKGASDDISPMRWAKASDLYVKEFAPKLIKAATRASFSARLAQESDDELLKRLCEAAWSRECSSPRSLLFAIRAALLHKRFFIFKAGRGTVFITTTKPSPLDPERAIESIGEVLNYLRSHPGCSREALVEGLRPGADPAGPEASQILSPFAWLIEKGHIIEFFDGTLAVPLDGIAMSRTRARPGKKKATR
jgi:hypothetical protein